MSTLETLLAGLFDYAGLYPPASLSLKAAANNYLEYSEGEHAAALGRFIVNLDRLEELRSFAGDSFEKFRLSVVAGDEADWESLAAQKGSGVRVESVEIKCSDPHLIERIAKKLSAGLEVYFEVPIDSDSNLALKTIRAAGARAKIRMGGVVREAIPGLRSVAEMLKALAEIRLSFKATAGLHHSLRSAQPLTYEPQCSTAIMHGFVNLTAAAALLYFGGTVDEAEQLLAEEDQTAWHVSGDSLRWRDRTLTTDQLAAVRQHFFMSIGSCSFEEPVQDLKSLGWL
jgi:hypothetical protein